MDLRFTMPGRAFPFVFRLALDDHGGLAAWNLGHGGLSRSSLMKK
jgi:hypothetical protein